MYPRLKRTLYGTQECGFSYRWTVCLTGTANNQSS